MNIIIFEGLDGCGKSSVARQITDQASADGMISRYLRDPGSTDFGEQVRNILLDPNIPMCPMASMLTYSSARAQLVFEMKKGAEDYDLFVLDRFWFSTVAYQSYGRGIPLAAVTAVNDVISRFTIPENFNLDGRLCFYLDVEDETAAERMEGRTRDRFERMGADTRARIRQGYDDLVSSGQMTAIDANRPLDEVVTDVWSACKNAMDLSACVERPD